MFSTPETVVLVVLECYYHVSLTSLVSLRLAAIGHGIRGQPLGIEFAVRCTTIKVGQEEVDCAA